MFPENGDLVRSAIQGAIEALYPIYLPKGEGAAAPKRGRSADVSRRGSVEPSEALYSIYLSKGEDAAAPKRERSADVSRRGSVEPSEDPARSGGSGS